MTWKGFASQASHAAQERQAADRLAAAQRDVGDLQVRRLLEKRLLKAEVHVLQAVQMPCQPSLLRNHLEIGSVRRRLD